MSDRIHGDIYVPEKDGGGEIERRRSHSLPSSGCRRKNENKKNTALLRHVSCGNCWPWRNCACPTSDCPPSSLPSFNLLLAYLLTIKIRRKMIYGRKVIYGCNQVVFVGFQYCLEMAPLIQCRQGSCDSHHCLQVTHPQHNNNSHDLVNEVSSKHIKHGVLF